MIPIPSKREVRVPHDALDGPGGSGSLRPEMGTDGRASRSSPSARKRRNGVRLPARSRSMAGERQNHLAKRARPSILAGHKGSVLDLRNLYST